MLSLPKILLVLAVVAVVVLLSKSLRGPRRRDDEAEESVTEDADDKALDLQPCAVCGDFVAEGGTGCERPDCPYA